jgi:hypothetical protein
MTSKKVALAAFCSIAAVLGAAGLAWGCTVTATMALSSQTGPAGAETVVTAEGLAPGPATIHWNSLSSATLAHTTADAEGRFTTPVRVPATSAGIYALVVVDSKGDVTRSAFEVTGADSPALAPATSTGADRGIPALALGVGVLAAGMVALAVGFAVASTVRRRVPVGVEVR